eukprot:m.64343 g.64343  ORF g.64343 m.64343 type:complete len:282 (+) comp13998_c0_seq1:75-920(+)
MDADFMKALKAACGRASRFFSVPLDGSWTSIAHPSQELLQQGPMCGLTAVAIAANMLNLTRHRSHPTDATDQKSMLQPSSLATTQVDPESRDLLLYAQQKHWTSEGEMFSSSALLTTLLDTYTADAKLVHNPTAIIVTEALAQGAAVLLPYDAAPNHEPCQEHGEASHWAVLVGLLVPPLALRTDTGDGTRITAKGIEGLGVSHIKPRPGLSIENDDDLLVLARHGKTKHLGVWSLAQLLASNAQLYRATTKDKYQHLPLPTDLSTDFNATAIIVRAPTTQ